MRALTKREYQVAELVAWGAAQKEVAEQLKISRFTVDNILRKAKEKLGLQKINEISAWYFCNRFNISMDLSPLKKQIVAIAFIGIAAIQIGWMDGDYARIQKPTKVAMSRSRKTE